MGLARVSPYIFRANSIRGIYGHDIDEDIFHRIGRAFAPFVKGAAVVVACDHRGSSSTLKDALAKGLSAAGCAVTDAGLTTKGLAAFAGWQLKQPLAYVSASHLPPEWNGIKFLHSGGQTFSPESCARIKDAFFDEPAAAPAAAARGRIASRDWHDEYLDFLLARLQPAAEPLNVLADCGNGTAALMAPELLGALGFMTAPLFAELDPVMPNRPSELTPEALGKACKAMPGNDLGLAWDGDADRVAFLSPEGRPVDHERFAFVILRELTKTDPGGIVANVSCGANIERVAARFKRKLWRTPTGTPHLIGKLLAEKAAYGMEASGHIVIPSVVPYDDGVAVGAYAAWALSAARAEGKSLAELLAEVPEQPRKRVAFEVADYAKAGVVRQLDARLTKEFGDGNVERMDGVRVRLPHGWALVRASNTEPGLRLFVEAENQDELASIVERFGEMIRDGISKSDSARILT